MNRFFAAAFAGLALSLPLGAMAAPDEAQKQLIQRAQEAKKNLAAAHAAQGPERDGGMRGHGGMGRK